MPDSILADDLTGALDAAGAFHRTGRRVVIQLAAGTSGPPDAPSDEGECAEVVALTTESRNDTPAMAAAKVRRTIEHLRASGGRLLFKKIDSTMRGPVAAELEALAKAWPTTRILFTPANPAVGRTVRDGVLYVHGVPVAETEFARDPANPVRESSVRRLLGAAVSGRVQIADASTQSELDAAVADMAAKDDNWIAVGSGALAVAVARRLKGVPGERKDIAEERIGPGPLLVLCGSAHSVNRAQASRFAREGGAVVHALWPGETGQPIAELAARLRAGGDVALMAAAERGERDEVLRAMAEAGAGLIDAGQVRRVFVTGGETAFALCTKLGIAALEFREEIEPGVSVTLARTSHGPILLAMKPGGFGDEETWVRVRNRLRSVGSNRAG